MSHNFLQGLAGFSGLGAVMVAQGHHGDNPYLRGNFQNGFYAVSYTHLHDILQAEVSDCGISGPAVPTHFPDGYTLLEISHGQNDISQGVFCALSNETGDLLTIDFQKYSDINQIGSLAIEKDGSPVEEYISPTGQRVYIMDNRGTTVATWSWGNWCLSLIHI